MFLIVIVCWRVHAKRLIISKRISMCLDYSFWERELKIELMLESFEEGICSMTSIKMNRLLNHDQLGSPHAISIVAVLIS
jgi:hypothetical protein